MTTAEYALEWAKVLVMPIVVAVIGIVFLRRIEGVKSSVGRQSEFRKKWADQFFECGQEFMQKIERIMALLQNFTVNKPKGEFENELVKEVSMLLIDLVELECRIRRVVAVAPSAESEVKKAAKECVELIRKLFAQKQGDVGEIIQKNNEFNEAFYKAHAELLAIEAAGKS